MANNSNEERKRNVVGLQIEQIIIMNSDSVVKGYKPIESEFKALMGG